MKQQHTPGVYPTESAAKGSIMASHRLYSSAPELLEALEAVDKAMANDPRWKVSTLRLNVVRTAIAKAKGETL